MGFSLPFQPLLILEREISLNQVVDHNIFDTYGYIPGNMLIKCKQEKTMLISQQYTTNGW